MRDHKHFYIDGAWTAPSSGATLDVINPATGGLSGRIGAGGAADVDRAVTAARAAFPKFSATSVKERLALLDTIIDGYTARSADIGAAIREEMGAPTWLADGFQTMLGLIHFQQSRDALATFELERAAGSSLLAYDPIGVCGLITPWNWPMNQVGCKVAPALAAGCTIVLKPSEVAPYSSLILAEILEAAGLPAGVFNLVNGTGSEVGAAIAAHPDIDLVSFTGSTRAGVQVARDAAPTVKRVLQELGGKSANVILDDADLTDAVQRGVDALMMNSGQTCNAPTRMLVPRSKMREAADIAGRAALGWSVGAPDGNYRMGPVATAAQWDKVQSYIGAASKEGASLVAGGPGRPDGLSTGNYVRPTVFADVTPEMRIAREEVFGPVLSIIGYDGEEEAISIANDSDYGLAAYVNGADLERCRAVARRLRAGQVFINAAENDFAMPFGGYKRSGNGREWGAAGLAEFFEVKAIVGYAANSG